MRNKSTNSIETAYAKGGKKKKRRGKTETSPNAKSVSKLAHVYEYTYQYIHPLFDETGKEEEEISKLEKSRGHRQWQRLCVLFEKEASLAAR